jgi:hypothetical protein
MTKLTFIGLDVSRTSIGIGIISMPDCDVKCYTIQGFNDEKEIPIRLKEEMVNILKDAQDSKIFISIERPLREDERFPRCKDRLHDAEWQAAAWKSFNRTWKFLGYAVRSSELPPLLDANIKIKKIGPCKWFEDAFGLTSEDLYRLKKKQKAVVYDTIREAFKGLNLKEVNHQTANGHMVEKYEDGTMKGYDATDALGIALSGIWEVGQKRFSKIEKIIKSMVDKQDEN